MHKKDKFIHTQVSHFKFSNDLLSTQDQSLYKSTIIYSLKNKYTHGSDAKERAGPMLSCRLTCYTNKIWDKK